MQDPRGKAVWYELCLIPTFKAKLQKPFVTGKKSSLHTAKEKLPWVSKGPERPRLFVTVEERDRAVELKMSLDTPSIASGSAVLWTPRNGITL